jgi:diguanylate cyclase (GGDEF)-like protein
MLFERKRAADAGLQRTAHTAPPAETQACRVLLVDDDQLVRSRLAALLRMSHYEVHTAATGAEALALLRTLPCEIVVTDWQMPDMDGLTLCRNLRRREHGGYVYLLLWTVRKGRRDVLTGLAAGADDYVIKGPTLQEILARIDVGRRITRMAQIRTEKSATALDADDPRALASDPLTGLPNLRYLMRELAQELGRSQRYNHPLSILSCDIDGFRKINEQFGPLVGDDVLRAFGARSSGCLRRSSDWIARTGADEFVVVLPETPLDGAGVVASKVRACSTEEPVQTIGGPVKFTVSIGVGSLETAYQLATVSVMELLRTADRHMHDGRRHAADAVAAAAPVGGS